MNTNINTHTHTHYNNNSNSTYNITYNTPTTQNYIASLNKISTHDNNNNLISTDSNRNRKILSHTSTIRTCTQTKTDEHNNRIPQHTMSTTQQLQCHIPQQQFYPINKCYACQKHYPIQQHSTVQSQPYHDIQSQHYECANEQYETYHYPETNLNRKN